jgi:predicted transcriptional regulator
MLYFNIQTKAVCKFFKWLDKPTCARAAEVLNEITKKLNKVEDANGTLVARIKDLENENDSCMERVRQSQKEDDKQIEIIRCLEKQNDNYRARDKFFMYALFLSWFTMLLIAYVALMK